MRVVGGKGVTLIELLIGMGLIGLMAVLGTNTLPAQFQKPRDARRKADLEKIKVALYDYYFDSDCFPKKLPGCGENLVSDSMVYLNNFPCDPYGNRYGYQVEDKECSQWFKILARLENTRDSGIDKVGCRQGCGPGCIYNYGLASTNIQVYEGCLLAETSPTPEGDFFDFGDGCFIATAVYGTPSASEVNILREFRDEVLLQNSLGQELVEFYYQNSPPIAEFISEHSLMREIVRRVGIDPIVEILKIYHPS